MMTGRDKAKGSKKTRQGQGKNSLPKGDRKLNRGQGKSK